jgi:hypothetical protein
LAGRLKTQGRSTRKATIGNKFFKLGALNYDPSVARPCSINAIWNRLQFRSRLPKDAHSVKRKKTTARASAEVIIEDDSEDDDDEYDYHDDSDDEIDLSEIGNVNDDVEFRVESEESDNEKSAADVDLALSAVLFTSGDV